MATATYLLECGHRAYFRHTARNLYYNYTMGYNSNDLLLACPNGCGLKATVSGGGGR